MEKKQKNAFERFKFTQNADLKFDFGSPDGNRGASIYSHDVSTERYEQSPTTDKKGAFSYQELVMHTPARNQSSTDKPLYSGQSTDNLPESEKQ